MNIAQTASSLIERVKKVGLARNAVAALLQSLLVGVCIFYLFRWVIEKEGLATLGVWTLLIAATAMARIGDVSGAGALSRFIALRLRPDDEVSTPDTIHTILITSVVFNTILGAIIVFIIAQLIPGFIAPEHHIDAYNLLPFAAILIVLTPVATSVSYGIDGTQRADQRAAVMSMAHIVYLLYGITFVGNWGIVGFAIAQILHQSFTLIASWMVLRKHIDGLGWFPTHWNYAIFRETTKYALKLNGIGIAGMLFEPLAKFSFNAAGGTAAVALYELVVKLIMQIRGLVIAAASPILPMLAAQNGPEDPEFKPTMRKAMTFSSITAVAVALAVAFAAPIASWLLLSEISAPFVIMTSILLVGWSINLISLPFYIAGQAHNVLIWNFFGHAILAACLIFGQALLIDVILKYIVTASISVGLIISGGIVLVGNARAFAALDVVRQSIWRIGIAIITIVLIGYLSAHSHTLLFAIL